MGCWWCRVGGAPPPPRFPSFHHETGGCPVFVEVYSVSRRLSMRPAVCSGPLVLRLQCLAGSFEVRPVWVGDSSHLELSSFGTHEEVDICLVPFTDAA